MPDVSTESWIDRLGSRWERRRNEAAAAAQAPTVELVLCTAQVSRSFPVPRADVWAAAMALGAPPGVDCRPVIGASASDITARHLHVTAPGPPVGLRHVAYHEIVAFEAGHWFTMETHTSYSEQTDTWRFLETADAGTHVIVDVQNRQPRVGGSTPEMRACLDRSVQGVLDRLASSVAGLP